MGSPRGGTKVPRGVAEHAEEARRRQGGAEAVRSFLVSNIDVKVLAKRRLQATTKRACGPVETLMQDPVMGRGVSAIRRRRLRSG